MILQIKSQTGGFFGIQLYVVVVVVLVYYYMHLGKKF